MDIIEGKVKEEKPVVVNNEAEPQAFTSTEQIADGAGAVLNAALALTDALSGGDKEAIAACRESLIKAGVRWGIGIRKAETASEAAG